MRSMQKTSFFAVSKSKILITFFNLKIRDFNVIKMAKKESKERCCDPNSNINNCKVDAIVSVDERGQMVLPKEVRNKAKINSGDKLAVVSWEKDEEVYCICLIKTEGLVEMVKDVMGPMVNELKKSK